MWEKITESIKVGDVFQNPGKGISTVKVINNEKIVYQRGNSRMTLRKEDAEDAYSVFRGKKVATNDLKNFRPQIFSTKDNGHDCNCTFLFCALVHIGFTNGSIEGSGVSGKPFYINLK